jgi:hypothetical protein
MTITKKTCEEIWHCYREIETAEQLLIDVENVTADVRHKHDEPKLKDVFGNRRDLELGLPTGENSKRLFRVPWTIAKYVIEAHVAAKKKELAECQIKAKMELDSGLKFDSDHEDNTAQIDTTNAITPFGRALRNMRFVKGMRLFDMAEKINFRFSHLVAIEAGREPIPDGFIELLIEKVTMSTDEITTLRTAANETRSQEVMK